MLQYLLAVYSLFATVYVCVNIFKTIHYEYNPDGEYWTISTAFIFKYHRYIVLALAEIADFEC